MININLLVKVIARSNSIDDDASDRLCLSIPVTFVTQETPIDSPFLGTPSILDQVII